MAFGTRAQRVRRRVMRLALTALALIALSTALVYARYRRDLSDARESLAGGSHLVQTSCGAIEYSEEGEGKPVLSIHGAGGGWDQGLLISAFVGEGFRVVAPSRFGYLNTPYPDDPSAVAQAERSRSARARDGRRVAEPSHRRAVDRGAR